MIIRGQAPGSRLQALGSRLQADTGPSSVMISPHSAPASAAGSATTAATTTTTAAAVMGNCRSKECKMRGDRNILYFYSHSSIEKRRSGGWQA